MLPNKIGMLKKLVTDIENMLKETEAASELLNDQLKTRLELHVELVGMGNKFTATILCFKKKKMLLINQLKKSNEPTSNVDKEKNMHQYVTTSKFFNIPLNPWYF